MSSSRPPRSHQREVLDTHGFGSPVIAQWLARSETVAALDRYDATEAKATRRQRRYFATARRATIFSTIGTAMAAFVLLPLDTFLGHELPPWLGLVQLAFVLLAFASIWTISWRQLLNRWMEARAAAEEARADLFRTLMRAELPANPGAEPLLVAKLAAFEACHLNYQRDYYKTRGAQLSRAASSVTPMKLIGYVIISLSVAVSFVVGLGVVRDFGYVLPPWLEAIATFSIPEPARMQLGLGALASAALSFAAAWTLINQDDSNASRYAHTLRKLNELTIKELDPARAAASAGRTAEVLAFTDRVQAIFDAEHGVWVTARPPENPTAGPGPALQDAI